MKRSYLLGAAFAAVVGLSIAAYAYVLPLVSTINNVSDVLQIIPGGNATPGNLYVYPSQITSTVGYQKAVPTTPATYTQTFAANQSVLMLNAANTLSYDYVYFAANPSDGSIECVESTTAVTALWLTKGASAQTVNNAAASLAAAGHVCYVYSLSNATWDRSE